MSDVVYVSGAVYADAAKQSIACTVTIAGRSGQFPYVAAAGDPTSAALFADLAAGKYGGVAAYAAPAPSILALRLHANARLATLLTTTRSYALASGPTVLSDASTATGVNLQGLTTWGTANGASTTQWVDNNGGVVTLTGAQCVALAEAVLAYGQSVYAVLATAMNGIANQTIATTAAIDALSWPT